jgi:Carboxypeptidase regulatory-like domain/TonB dependent receptor
MQMIKKSWLVIVVVGCITIGLRAQTTNGLITGVVADSTGAVVAGAQVSIVNRDTGVERKAVSDASGLYVVPQLAPGGYTLMVMKEGFASVKQNDIQLLVNQSLTIDLKLKVASSSQTIEVSTAPPMLNTTSSTISEVIGHEETVDLPLNGREFTQLALLTPGAVPQEGGQQSGFTVALGAGGISPAISGQRANQNNFTMDGVLNNSIYTNVWTISPPPDAIQEFSVQTHITDAQFAISSGTNINLVTRSGTNQFHGSVWEFLRNDVLDAQTYPDTKRLVYRQNQYGLYLGGPVIKNNTWFSLYWEGFRFAQANTSISTTLTPDEIAGNFSAEEGTTPIGTDSQGRPEYANEIYDPTTSTPDPAHPGEYLRNPFPGNIIPTQDLNAASLALAARYFPKPNLNVPEGALNNFVSTVPITVKSDVFGLRLDHQFTPNDTAFLRFNRTQANKTAPYNYNTSTQGTRNYAQVGALNYVHTFNPQTILNFRLAYSYTNNFVNDGQPDPATVAAMGFTAQDPVHAGEVFAPNTSIGNGYSGIGNFAIPLGPIETFDYHLDLSKVMGNHTLGVGGMYYHIRSFDDGWGISAGFVAVGTAQDGGETGGVGTGFGPASFMLGTLDSYAPWVGATGADQTENWYGWYAQDQWHATRNLVVTAGIRWDFVSPPNYHRVESGLDMATGQVCITGAVPPQFPHATCPSGYFYNQYNGWEPRFGVSYRAANHTVVHSAIAMLDDHNNTLVQENQNIRLSWPGGALPTLSSLDLGSPTNAYWNALPAAASFLGANNPFGVSYGADPRNKIPYSIEYNLGVQQQLQEHLTLEANYVGSVGRHGYIADATNTAVTPGPGPIQPRALYPQYGTFNYSLNGMPSSYNALQVELNKQMSEGLSFKGSYTWSKSMDWQSDPYGTQPRDYYNLRADWGPSDYNRPQLFVFSSIYQLPVGKGKQFLKDANTFSDKVLGGWSLGTIISLESGAPTDALANGDVANTGWPSQRAQRTGADPYSVSGGSGFKQWLNPAAFAQPAPFTVGNESRNDLHGPSFKNVDFNASKLFPLTERTNLIFRAEMFNLFNHTNYGLPSTTVANSNFGQITNTANGGTATGRLVQFALKVQF